MVPFAAGLGLQPPENPRSGAQRGAGHAEQLPDLLLFFSQEPAPEVGIKEIVEDGEVLGERRVGRGRWIGGEEGAGGSEIDEGEEFFQVEIGQATDTDDVAELQRSFASEESAQGAAAQAHGGVRLAVAGAYDLEEVLERPKDLLFVALCGRQRLFGGVGSLPGGLGHGGGAYRDWGWAGQGMDKDSRDDKDIKDIKGRDGGLRTYSA
jgi:hypothetical protein